MYKVKINNACSCFIKSGMSEVLEYATEEEAKLEAESTLKRMQTDFCNKHAFSLVEQFGDYTIYIKPRN